MKSLDAPFSIGIIGLGLIGGSMAKALKQNTPHTIYGYDLQESVVKKAILADAIDAALTEEVFPTCDLLIVALYPHKTIEFVQENCDKIKQGAVVLDCSGVKRVVCSTLEPLAKENGFVFMGGHPMAGVTHSGFSHAQEALFENASMVLTPASGTPIAIVHKIKQLCMQIGFTKTQISTPEEHDRAIAFTSQLAHVVSSAYIKSPFAVEHEGFIGGSYKDMTRVAKMNENMWTELFLSNAEFLAEEVDGIIHRLEEYSNALKLKDASFLKELLKDGCEKKALIDRKN